MARDFFPSEPLRLDPRFERRQAVRIALLALLTLPGIYLLMLPVPGGVRPRPLALPVFVLLLGLAPAVWAYLRYRSMRRIVQNPEELHAPIVSRTELVQNDVPSERITYAYRLPPLPDNKRVERVRRVEFGLKEGSPLYTDPRGDHLVVLVPRGRRRPCLPLRADFYPVLLDPKTRSVLRHRQIQDRLSFSFGRGFKNLDVVASSLRLLLSAEAQEKLPARPSAPWTGTGSYEPNDPLISAQKLAREVAQSFGFEAGPIVVRFDERLEPAGQVEYEPDTGFFVEVRKEFATRPAQMAAILAHEVAHIFLTVHGLVPENRFENEIATDVAAALWGFGPVMIETHKSELVYGAAAGTPEGQGVRKVTQLSYLTPDELAYVLAKLVDTRPLLKKCPGHARRAYRAGRARARAEARTPPLETAGLFRRIPYALRRALWTSGRKRFPGNTSDTGGYRLEQEHVIFRCPRCTQHLRLPLRKTGTASCPNCRAKHPFTS